MEVVSFGENLKLLRERVNLTQFEVAVVLQISRQSISKWENNITTPTIDMLVPVTKLYNCTLDDLFQIKSKAKVMVS